MTLTSSGWLVDFRSVFEATPGLLIIVARDLTIMAVNASFCQATMTQRDDIIGRHVSEVFPHNPEDPQATGVNNVRSSFQHVLEFGRPDAMVAQKYDIRRPDSECGLIVNELISNALKHGFPDGRRGHIKIDLSRTGGDRIVLSVSDDGVGIRPDLDMANATTLGLKLVFLLVDQLDGEISVNRSNPTRFELRFEVQA